MYTAFTIVLIFQIVTQSANHKIFQTSAHGVLCTKHVQQQKRAVQVALSTPFLLQQPRRYIGCQANVQHTAM